MDATQPVQTLCRTIDERRRGDLPALLHPDFVCRYVHTGETLDGTAWVRTSAEYPGFDRMVVEEVVGTGGHAVARCHVTCTVDGEPVAFGVASFVTEREGLIGELTEVWADIGQIAPDGTRPG